LRNKTVVLTYAI